MLSDHAPTGRRRLDVVDMMGYGAGFWHGDRHVEWIGEDGNPRRLFASRGDCLGAAAGDQGRSGTLSVARFGLP